MHWSLPLAALSAISGFNSSEIASEDHYSRTTDINSKLWPWRSYKSSHHTPPDMEIVRSGLVSEGYVFVTPANQKGAFGMFELSGTGYIFTTEGDLVFAGDEGGYGFCNDWVAGMTDMRKQMYNGRPHLVYWNGCNTKGTHWGHRWGRVTFIDEEYNNFTINPDLNINSMDPANKGQIDMHDHQMTDRNTMVVTSYNVTRTDLVAFGGEKDGYLAESLFFEIDINTGNILFEWKASDHIGLHQSRFNMGGAGTEKVPWDWFHINSVQLVGDNYLVSARHCWAIYLINGKDGSVIWKFDGKNGGNFPKVPSHFSWQHHARAHNVTDHGMTVSMFNNGVNTGPTRSQGLAFWIPWPTHRDNPPVLVRKLEEQSEEVFGGTQGSYQFDVGGGNGFVSYGKLPVMREYAQRADGTSEMIWQARYGFDGAVMSYRAFKDTWKGTPKNWDPSLVYEKVALQGGGPGRAYVSWNGATDISGWAIFAGDTLDNMTSVAIAPKKGFETVFDVPHKPRCLQLGAIRNDEIVRGSNIVCLNSTVATGVIGASLDVFGADQLQAQKEQLENELKQLQKKLRKQKSGAWTSYRLFAEVASGVVLIVAVTWGYILWRDWRYRRQYEDVEVYEPTGLGRGLNFFKLGKSREMAHVRYADDAIHDKDSRLKETNSYDQRSKASDDGAFKLAEEDYETDEDEPGVTSRTPFIRVPTET